MDKETSSSQSSSEPTEPKPAPTESEPAPQPEAEAPSEQPEPEQKTPVTQQAPKNPGSSTTLPLALIITGLFLMLAMVFLYFMQ